MLCYIFNIRNSTLLGGAQGSQWEQILSGCFSRRLGLSNSTNNTSQTLLGALVRVRAFSVLAALPRLPPPTAAPMRCVPRLRVRIAHVVSHRAINDGQSLTTRSESEERRIASDRAHGGMNLRVARDIAAHPVKRQRSDMVGIVVERLNSSNVDRHLVAG